VLLKDGHGLSHPFDPKLQGEREERACRTGKTDKLRKSRNYSGLAAKDCAMQLKYSGEICENFIS
jgi:hypothetical protein